MPPSSPAEIHGRCQRGSDPHSPLNLSVFDLGAPKATAAQIIDKLNAQVNEIINAPKVPAQLADLGGTVLTLSPTKYRELIVEETDKWARVIQTANINVERRAIPTTPAAVGWAKRSGPTKTQPECGR